MALSDYLFKFENNNIVKLFMENALNAPEQYASIEKTNETYKIVPTNLFLSAANVKSAELEISRTMISKKLIVVVCSFIKIKYALIWFHCMQLDYI